MGDDKANVTVQYGRTRLVIQVSILGLVVFLTGYVTLLADRHNDERYVKQEDYKRDRENDEKLRAALQLTITYRMDMSDKKLEEISRDIKSLLSRPTYEEKRQ